MAKLKITGTKAIINEAVFRAQCDKHATDMKENAIRRAPKETGKLKSEGIKKETISDGTKVFLDTKSVHYGLYQELGWKQHGITTPGKFFMESAFELECAKGQVEASKLLRESVTKTASNGYDIVEYRRSRGGLK